MENEILNFSRIEEDPFAELNFPSSNTTETVEDLYEKWRPTTLQQIMNYIFVVLALAKFLVVIASLLADILLIYLILRYKRLRKKYNIYIVHYAITNILYYIISPLFLLFHMLVMQGFHYLEYVYCYAGMLEITFLYMTFIFAILLGLDWTVTSFRPHWFEKIPKIYKYKYYILYAFLVFMLIVNCMGCAFRFEIAHDIFIVLWPAIVIILIGMHYIRRQKILNSEQLKTEYSLWICTIAIGLFIPMFIFDLILRFYNDFSYNDWTIFIFVIEFIFSLVSTPGPILILFYLNKWNKYVRMAYDTTFKKAVRSYGADNLDDASDNEEIVENGADKNFQNISTSSDTQNIIVP